MYICTYAVCSQFFIQTFQIFFPILYSPFHFCGLLLLTAHNEDSLEITHGFLESLCLQSQSQTCRTFVSSKGPFSQWLCERTKVQSSPSEPDEAAGTWPEITLAWLLSILYSAPLLPHWLLRSGWGVVLPSEITIALWEHKDLKWSWFTCMHLFLQRRDILSKLDA